MACGAAGEDTSTAIGIHKVERYPVAPVRKVWKYRYRIRHAA